MNMTIIEQIKAEIEKLIERYSSVKAKGVLQEGYKGGRLIGYEDALNILKRIQEESEKPINQDELEREISKKYANDTTTMRTREQYAELARYFYDLGCRRTAEKFDDIEYNRQRAEESEKPTNKDELEKEISKSIENLEGCTTKIGDVPEYHLISDEDLREFANHFAQWGAEHLKK